jgi:hypothetical protein
MGGRIDQRADPINRAVHGNAWWEVDMNGQRNLLVLAAALAAAGLALSGVTRPAVGQANGALPDFSGTWRHGSLPWFIPPASGPGPVTNRSRRKDNGQSDYGSLVGDYTNPILQPWAADVVKKDGDLSLAGIIFPSPANQCWPEPVPYLFKHMAIQILQLSDRTVMLFNEDHEVRVARMNAQHPAKTTPSWHGDAVGHYEGDTLVIDTVGVKTDRPYAMVDLFGTPYTDKLHVVERWRLADYEEVKDDIARGAKENWRPQGPIKTAEYNDKYLQARLTVEDPGALTKPWSASIIYLRDRRDWDEAVCAENRFGFEGDADVPHAQKADF